MQEQELTPELNEVELLDSAISSLEKLRELIAPEEESEVEAEGTETPMSSIIEGARRKE